jgi:hypothetical protein
MGYSERGRGVSIWAFILIGIGAIWLLGQAGILRGENFSVLGRIWPIVLIAAGVALLLGSRSRALSTIIGLGTLVLIIALMVVGPSIGLSSNVEAQEGQYSEPLDDAESADVTLEMAVGTLNLNPLLDSANLMEANISYLGTVEFSENDAPEREIALVNEFESNNPFDFLGLIGTDDEEGLVWNVGLNPDVPLELTVNTGTGSANLLLGDFDVTALNINTGTGGVTATLPVTETAYNARVNTGTGGINLTLEEGAALTLRLNSGTGGATVDVPDGAAVRLTADVGTGGIEVSADNLERVSGEDDNFVGDSGIWETEGFEAADRQIIIDYDGGTGGLTVE